MIRGLQKFRYQLKRFKAFEVVYSALIRRKNAICYNHHRRALHRNGARVMQLFNEAMLEAGCSYWLDYGTLLGAMREHDFIAHDSDIDTGCLWGNNLAQVEEALAKRGFKKSRQISVDGQVTEQTYDILGTSVDIFFYFGEKEALTGYLFNAVAPYSWNETLVRLGGYGVRTISTRINGLKSLNFKGVEVQIPENWDWYLKNVYGDTYMTPDPAFKHSTTTAITHHPNLLGVPQNF